MKTATLFIAGAAWLVFMAVGFVWLVWMVVGVAWVVVFDLPFEPWGGAAVTGLVVTVFAWAFWCRATSSAPAKASSVHQGRRGGSSSAVLGEREEERRSGAVAAPGPVSVPDKPGGSVALGRPPGDWQCRQGEAVKRPEPAPAPESGAEPGTNPEYLGNDFRAVYIMGFIKSDVAAGSAVRAARQCYGQAHVPYLGLHMTTARGRVRKTAPADSSAR